jgi:type VI protein secretion system component VasF
MTAYQLYEPVFLYMCQLNRLARNGAHLSYGDVRTAIVSLLDQIKNYAEQHANLREQVRELDNPIRYFIDYLIMEPKSKIAFADQWSRNKLGADTEGLAGDEAFFDYYLDPALEEARRSPSEPLADRLLIYYTCIGLGFEGRYFNKPDELRNYMTSIRDKTQQLIPADDAPHITPQAYQGLDERNLVRPPKAKPFAILSALCCLLLSGFCFYFLLYKKIREKVPDQMRYILESYQSTDQSE